MRTKTPKKDSLTNLLPGVRTAKERNLKFYQIFKTSENSAVSKTVTFSASSRMDESSKSCSHLQHANRAGCTPLHLSPFTSQFCCCWRHQLKSRQWSVFGKNMRVVESCEMTSYPVFLHSERVHKKSFVLFHALVSHSVYSHRSPSDSEHARVEPCTRRGQMRLLFFCKGPGAALPSQAGWH